MAITRTHELHQRRLGRNVGLSVALVAFVAIMFGLTVVKISHLGQTQGFDHVVRPELAAPPAERAN